MPLSRLILASTMLFISVKISAQTDYVLATQADVDAFDPTITVVNGNLDIGDTFPTDIVDLTPLSNIIEITGFLRLVSNRQLLSLRGLENIKKIGYTLSINANGLQTLDGLNVDSLGFDLQILGNPDLEDIEALNTITELPDELTIFNSPKLTTLEGLRNLKKTRYLTINSCGIQDINGLRSLDSLDGLNLFENIELTDITSLRKFTSMEALGIRGNDKLTSLDGMENLVYVRNLGITSNDSLVDCCAIKDLINTPNSTETLTIRNPLLPCSSESAIIQECGINYFLSLNDPCIDADNGEISIKLIDPDTFPIRYEWLEKNSSLSGSGEVYTEDLILDGLMAGCYNITLTSLLPDTAIIDDLVMNSVAGNVFEIIEVQSNNSSNSFPNGSVKLFLSGGRQPFAVQWEGPSRGTDSSIFSDTLDIGRLAAGEYNFQIQDASGKAIIFDLTLLDDIVPIIPCNEPLDVIVLNDVSGSVDEIEYLESQQFFVDLFNEMNIESGPDGSRAAVIEWSNSSELKIGMTDNLASLAAYADSPRIDTLGSGTNPFQAMQFAEAYMNSVSRPNAAKVIVLSTDGTPNQISPALLFYADELKSKGYNIVTIAFDEAFTSSESREKLREIASIDLLAPGASAYSLLDGDLAENIVNLYVCPLEPGDFAQAYFSRDGAIEFKDIRTIGNCPYPSAVEVDFAITAFRDLSIPSGMPVSFYYNDPSTSAADYILSWKVPCTIPIGTEEIFTLTLSANGPGNIYAVLNDDGIIGPPVQFPLTEYIEIAYSNNIDNINFCGDQATLRVNKTTSTPNPVCGNQIFYIIDICNTSAIDAIDIELIDVAPSGFVLTNSTFLGNGCGAVSNNIYDIPANCCGTLTLTYDASDAELGTYDDQDVLINGPSNQVYIEFDGATTTDENVTIDGTVDCPSTNIQLSKNTATQEICDDNFITYEFSLLNETVIPLRGMTFRDTLPDPAFWVFQPYNIDGLEISNFTIDSNIITVNINKINALSEGRFFLDAQLGTWDTGGMLNNTAYLEKVPDLEFGGQKAIATNTTSTNILAAPELSVPDTIRVDVSTVTVDISAELIMNANYEWTSAGDGVFTITDAPSTQYIIGNLDSIESEIIINISAKTECHETNETVLIIIYECAPKVDINILDCNDADTPSDPSDDFFGINFNALTNTNSPTYNLTIDGEEEFGYRFGLDYSAEFPADGEEIELIFTDVELSNCSQAFTLSQNNCSDACSLEMEPIIINICDNNGTPSDPADDTFEIQVTAKALNPGVNNKFNVIIDNEIIGTNIYDGEIDIILPANGENIDLIIMDSDNSNCFQTESILAPNSCSDICLLELEQFEVCDCQDPGTSIDSSDDVYSISFNIGAINNSSLESDYYIESSLGTFGPYEYALENVIELPADGVLYELVFIGDDNSNCEPITKSVSQESCSAGCTLIAEEATISNCSNNDTAEDIDDDYFVTSILITNSESATEEEFLLFLDSEPMDVFPYGYLHEINIPADGKTHTLEVRDIISEECSLEFLLEQDHCSYEEEPELYIPNAFSSGLLTNDNTWEVVSPNEDIQFIDCRIYDRWGNLIFETEASDKIIWNGTKNDSPVNQGVYTFILNYEINDDFISTAGTITLLK